MEPGALGTRQRAVRDLADEDVPEGRRAQLRLTRMRSRSSRSPIAASTASGAQRRVDGRDRARLERPPEHRPELDDATRGRRQRVEPRQDGRLDACRGVRRSRPATASGIGHRPEAVHERAHDLAGVERVALGAVDDGVHDLRRRRVEQVGDEGLDGARRQRLERDRDGVPTPAAPARPAVEELGPGERDHHERHVGARLEHRLDEVEQAVARPVEVLDDEHERGALGGHLDEPPPRGEERDPVALDLGGADRRGKQLRRALRVGLARRSCSQRRAPPNAPRPGSIRRRSPTIDSRIARIGQ